MKFRLFALVLAMPFISGCVAGAQYVRDIKPENFQGNAVLVGSLVSPDDGIIDIFFVQNPESGEGYRVTDRESIPEDNEHYQVGMFALVVPPGHYVYASVNYSGSADRGGASMTWAGPLPLLDRAVEAGDFIYVGRAFCDATIHGCNWSLDDESNRDLPILKKINPRLPWERVEIQ